MKYKHFNDIEPNHKTDFIMLYFAACRSLSELEAAIRRTNGGKLTCREAWLLRRIQRKLSQMAALWKHIRINTDTSQLQKHVIYDRIMSYRICKVQSNWKELIISTLDKKLVGDWVKRPNTYEKDLCKETLWQDQENRYFDAVCNGVNIEIKKGTSIWLDLRRYAEIVKHHGPETITCFFIPDKNKTYIQNIFIVDTTKIINWLNITQETADKILEINVPRGLNMQASMTVKDVKQMADVILQF